ncbi:MAG: glycosyltransferase family 2 protein [bacterium]
MTCRLTIQIVTWNSASVIDEALVSLKKQSFKAYRLVIIDNGSSDDSVVRAKRIFPDATYVENQQNLGFSAAHNQGIRLAETEYVAIVNPDIVFTQDALGVLLDRLDRNPKIGSITAKLLKNGVKPAMIDAAGITVHRNRVFHNRGEGEEDHGQYDTPQEVFGSSGAFVVYRQTALESVRIGEEYFDEAFFAYKEDIDIAWRLRFAGWLNFYEPGATLLHHRSARREHVRAIVRSGRAKSAFLRRISYRNHLLLLIKNDRYREWFFPLPRVFLYEIGKFIYILFREPATVMGFFEAIRAIPLMRKKRKIAMRCRVAAAGLLSRWFV